MKGEHRLDEYARLSQAARAGILVLVYSAPLFPDQVFAQDQHVKDSSIRLKRASATTQSCAPTKADLDPDVFRRPCFNQALSKSRQAFGMHAGFTRMGLYSIELPRNQIPGANIRVFRVLLESVLQPPYLPHSWEEIDLWAQVACPERTITEVRVPGGAPTVIGMKRDCSLEVKDLKEGEVAILGEWRIGSIDVLPRTLYRKKTSRNAVVRLRLRGDERLQIRPRPPDFGPGGDRMNNKWDFFNRDAFYTLLVSVFCIPFDSRDDFSVIGYDTVYEGVRVFHGKIRSRDRMTQFRANKSSVPAHWWDEMRLFVTDSDPQYFCVQIALSESDLSGRKRGITDD